MQRHHPPEPVHVKGTAKGEERVRDNGREPGREEPGENGYRSSRDSTGISPKNRRPIDPRMPNIPPA
jgi:hypothetical protein